MKPYKIDEHGVKNYHTWYLLLISLAILFTWVSLGASILLYCELGAEGANVDNYGDSFWLLILSCSTIGFGDFFAVTFWGRVVVGCSFFVGVGVAGYIGALLAGSVLGFSDTNVKNRELQTLLKESLEQDCDTLKQVQANEHHILALEAKIDALMEAMRPEGCDIETFYNIKDKP